MSISRIWESPPPRPPDKGEAPRALWPVVALWVIAVRGVVVLLARVIELIGLNNMLELMPFIMGFSLLMEN